MDRIDEIIKKMENIILLLWENNEQAYQILAEQSTDLQSILKEMLDYLCLLRNKKIEVPLDIILQQINNFDEALRKKDDLMLADVLKYELTESLYYYKGILSTDGK